MLEPFVLPFRDDPEARLQLVQRTLQVGAGVWRQSLADYGRAPELRAARAEQRLAAFARVFASHCPHRAALPDGAAAIACSACAAGTLRPLLARDPGALVYGRCDGCGHGALLRGAGIDPPARSYAGAGYYERRDGHGVGYDAYAREAAYRERKGEQLVARIARGLGAAPDCLLEVGSGYGYTRIAAERSGIRTHGVERNPHACEEARLRYGLPSFCGELAQALASPGSGIAEGGAAVVLYQYVLEHVRDVAAELRAAHRALRARGALVLLVPSMDAAEIDVFGASYRSFRADHEHLFSRASIAHVLRAAGF